MMQYENWVLKIENILYHHHQKQETKQDQALSFESLLEQLELPDEELIQKVLSQMIDWKLIYQNSLQDGYSLTGQGKKHYKAFAFFKQNKNKNKNKKPLAFDIYNYGYMGDLNNNYTDNHATTETNIQDCSISRLERPRESTEVFDRMSDGERKELIPEYQNIYNLVTDIVTDTLEALKEVPSFEHNGSLLSKIQQLKNIMKMDNKE